MCTLATEDEDDKLSSANKLRVNVKHTARKSFSLMTNSPQYLYLSTSFSFSDNEVD
jgi:hypothetical protein